ncbi:hypothetical protein IEO21_06340 [Rhodonia placenta]|uniref:Uncharacterized protein n=1 Tax=Rhodonia placenta TaxID=104341 RepID=A0A8H7P073_9APHY|nr:hypothetical protein IEO21_06340 [Postia placenta]
MILSIYVFGSISEYIIGKMVMLYAPPDSDTSLDRRISLDNLDCMACGRINSAGTSPEAQEVMASTSPEEPVRLYAGLLNTIPELLGLIPGPWLSQQYIFTRSNVVFSEIKDFQACTLGILGGVQSYEKGMIVARTASVLSDGLVLILTCTKTVRRKREVDGYLFGWNVTLRAILLRDSNDEPFESRHALDMRDVNAAESDFYEAEDMLERTLRFRGICDDEDEELQGPALEGIIGITQSSAPPTSSPYDAFYRPRDPSVQYVVRGYDGRMPFADKAFIRYSATILLRIGAEDIAKDPESIRHRIVLRITVVKRTNTQTDSILTTLNAPCYSLITMESSCWDAQEDAGRKVGSISCIAPVNFLF